MKLAMLRNSAEPRQALGVPADMLARDLDADVLAM